MDEQISHLLTHFNKHFSHIDLLLTNCLFRLTPLRKIMANLSDLSEGCILVTGSANSRA